MSQRVRWTFFVGVAFAVTTGSLGACSSEEELPARPPTKKDAAADPTGEGGAATDAAGTFDTGVVPQALCTKMTADDWRALGPLVKQDLARDCRTSPHLANASNLARIGECMGHTFAAVFCPNTNFNATGCRDPIQVHRGMSLKVADLNVATQSSFATRLGATKKLTTAEANEAVRLLAAYAAQFNPVGVGDGGLYSACSCPVGAQPQNGKDSCGRNVDAGNNDAGNDARTDANDGATGTDASDAATAADTATAADAADGG